MTETAFELNKHKGVGDIKNELAKGGFPLLTHQFVSDSKTQLAFIKKQLSNATFLGSGGGSHFLMNQVLVDVYEQLTALMHNR